MAYLNGIDVSVDQGEIVWSSVASSGVAWAYAKATEGLAYVDLCGEHNIAGAKAANIPCGVYHFFHFNDDPAQQAQRFLSITQSWRGTLQPMVDVEVSDGYDDVEQMVARLGVFVDAVEHALGHEMFIYTGWSFWNEQMGGSDAFAGKPRLWVAAYNDDDPNEPGLQLPNGWNSVSAWQHTDALAVPGITGHVDGDRLYVPLSDITL